MENFKTTVLFILITHQLSNKPEEDGYLVSNLKSDSEHFFPHKDKTARQN